MIAGPSSSERATLVALMAALEDPEGAAMIADDPLVLVVARRHRLTPLLSIRCRRLLPAALDEACRRDHLLTAARHLALSSAAEECVTAMTDAGVDVALLKGLAYERTLYPQPGARPTSDIDLLVRDRDRRRAFEVLDRLGFEPRAAAPGFDAPDYHEVAWRRGPVEVDLHMALAPLARCAIDYEDVWRDMRPLELGAARAFALAPTHAAVFHALHMAIDHFDVPALYLLDLARLLPTSADAAAAHATARAWRCHRPLKTSVALAAAFQPRWAATQPLEPPSWPAARVTARFGALPAVPRPEQLLRKFAHFDRLTDALLYTAVQARRNLHELVERRVRRRSARERLKLPRPSR
ncbi:MAG TPA: nucleotidyltransferase family protein [Polyangia bacterium]